MAGSFLGGLTGGAIGSAVVRLVLDDSQYTRGLAQAKGEAVASTTSMGASFNKAKILGAAAFAALGTYAIQYGAQAVQAASNQEEALNKTRVVFGETSSAVESFAKTAAESLGLSETAALGAASSFGTMLSSAGFAADEIGAFSVELTTLGADLASFNNIQVDEALLKLRSGLAGEAEPLRQLGVFLSEAKVKAEAYASGIAAVGSELTESQKVQARYNIIIEETAKAQGDFARTSDSLANQQRILAAEMENLQAEVGQQLLPVVKELVPIVVDLAEAIGPVLTGAFVAAAEAIGPSVELLARLVDLMPEVSEGADSAEQSYGILNRTLVDTNSLQGSQVALGLSLVDALEYLTRGLGDAEVQQGSYNDAVNSFRERMEGVLNPTELFNDANRQTEEQAKEAAAALQEQIDAMYALESVQLELAGGVLGLIESARSYAEAQDEVNRLEARGKEGTDAYREAVGNLLGERLQLEQQFIDFGTQLAEEGTSVAEAREALKEYGIEAGLSKEAMRTFMNEGLAPVRDELRRVNEEMDKFDGRNATATLTLRTTVIGNTVEGYDPGLLQGTAAGGILRGARGFVTRNPTFLVGEGNYSTFAGRGAEAVVPLDERGIEILAEAVRRGTGGRGGGVTLHFHGDVYADDDFGDKVIDAIGRHDERSVLI